MKRHVFLLAGFSQMLVGCAAGNPQTSQSDQSFSILGYDTPLPELPPLTQTTNGEHRVDIVDTSKAATKSYADESYVIPALPEELPTYKTFAFNGQEYLDYGTFHGYRVTSYRQKDGWGNGEFPHAYVIGPHRYRVLDAFNIIPSGFGVNEGDDPSELNDETFPWNDTHWLPFLYASGLVDDSVLLSIFLQTLAYQLDKGLYTGYAKDDYPSKRGAMADAMQSIVSAKGWEDYAVRSSVVAESREIEPYGYGIGLDESIKKSIEVCHYHGQQGQEIRLTFDQTGIILNFGRYNGFTVFSRLGNVAVDEGSGPKAYATSVPYSLTMGRRSYFGREDDQCPPIWLYDPSVGCLDLSYAYHEGYLGDNQINHIAHQFYAYRLDCVQDKQDFAAKYKAGWDINFRIPVRYSPTQEARDLFEKPILG